MTVSLRIRSYAKINWTLDVLFRREDGFHELRTIYQTVSLFDRMHISQTKDTIEIECNNPTVPCDSSNLIIKAALRLKEAADIRMGAHISLEKNIPVAGGMGGGSSNAAAALIGLSRLWGLDLTEEEMFRVAETIGSDVPLFLIGGTILGLGRGEEVYPIEQVDCDAILLANPDIAIHTASAYSRLSRLTRLESPRIIPFSLFAARGIRELPLVARNDLEDAVISSHPEIADLKRRIMTLGARHALMSGSGSTVFGVFDNIRLRDEAHQELKNDRIWSKPVRTIDRSEYWNTFFES